MNKKEKALIMAKKIQCWIGFGFLIPPILGVIAFVLCLFDYDNEFASMRNLSGNWTTNYSSGGGGMSAAPIYLAMMSFTGAYLIKDSLRYLFISVDSTKNETTESSPKESISNEPYSKKPSNQSYINEALGINN